MSRFSYKKRRNAKNSEIEMVIYGVQLIEIIACPGPDSNGAGANPRLSYHFASCRILNAPLNTIANTIAPIIKSG